MENKKIVSILERHKLGQLSTYKSVIELLVLFDVKKSSYCKEDNLITDCPIIKYTQFKSCEGCGHYIP